MKSDELHALVLFIKSRTSKSVESPAEAKVAEERLNQIIEAKKKAENPLKA